MSKFEGYAQIADASVLAAVELLVRDPNDTSMSANGTTKQLTLGQVLEAHKVYNVVAFGADPTGATSSDTALAAAKTAAGAKSRATIYFPPGTYLLSPFTFDGFHWLGAGPYSSILKAASTSLDFATNAGVASGSVPTDGSETMTVIEGLCFDGTNMSGTNANNIYGSTYAGPVTNATSGAPVIVGVGNGTPSGTFGAGIPSFIIRHCVVRYGCGIGVSTAFSRGGLPSTMLFDVFVHDMNNGSGSQPGFHVGSDSLVVGNVSENNNGPGFYATGQSYGAFGNKSYSGLTSNGYGYWFENQTSGATWAACQSQDNYAGGVYFRNAQGYNVTGFLSDSDGPNAPGGVGATFANSSYNYLQYEALDRYYNNVNKLTNALTLDSTSVGNKIICSALYRTGGSAAMTWLASGSANGAGNDIQFGASLGLQSLAYAATINPDPTVGGIVNVGTLGGALTVGPAAAQWAGARLTFFFTQDATGSRNITWDSSYVFQTAWTNTGNNPSKRSSASFVSNGTNWISVNSGVNVWF